MQHQLIDSLVSVREHRDGSAHLGLGLYIVALVAKFHGGRVAAENRPGGDGVRIVVHVPRAESRSTG